MSEHYQTIPFPSGFGGTMPYGARKVRMNNHTTRWRVVALLFPLPASLALWVLFHEMYDLLASSSLCLESTGSPDSAYQSCVESRNIWVTTITGGAVLVLGLAALELEATFAVNARPAVYIVAPDRYYMNGLAGRVQRFARIAFCISLGVAVAIDLVLSVMLSNGVVL